MSFDYGSKRTGIAITDPLKIIASPYKTCNTYQVIEFINEFISNNKIDKFVVGMPLNLKNQSTNSTALVNAFVILLKKKFPSIPIKIYDERFTSKIAKQAILDAGKNKKFRKVKSNVDKISASLILQSYLTKSKK